MKTLLKVQGWMMLVVLGTFFFCAGVTRYTHVEAVWALMLSTVMTVVALLFTGREDKNTVIKTTKRIVAYGLSGAVLFATACISGLIQQTRLLENDQVAISFIKTSFVLGLIGFVISLLMMDETFKKQERALPYKRPALFLIAVQMSLIYTILLSAFLFAAPLLLWAPDLFPMQK